jgi:putative transposase
LLKEVNEKNGEAAGSARTGQLRFGAGLSPHRASGLFSIPRSSPSCELSVPTNDAPVMQATKGLSAQYPRYGYRRLRSFLRRQCFGSGWSCIHRLRR